jgi:hypothetical protein
MVEPQTAVGMQDGTPYQHEHGLRWSLVQDVAFCMHDAAEPVANPPISLVVTRNQPCGSYRMLVSCWQRSDSITLSPPQNLNFTTARVRMGDAACIAGDNCTWEAGLGI